MQRIVEAAALVTEARYAALGVIDRTGTALERFVTTGIDEETRAAMTTSGYAWDPWQSVTSNERKKAGFDGLASTMQELSAP